MKYLLLLISLNSSYGMGLIKDFCSKYPDICGVSEEPEPPPPPPPTLPPPPPPPPPQPVDFDWSKVKKYGGPDINIAKEIAEWKVTRTFKLKSVSGMKLSSSIDGSAYEPAIDGLSGTFNAAVEQEDGSYIVGSWDYCRASYQSVKTLENLHTGGAMAASFGLRKGSKICFFYSGLARSNKRNTKERSNLDCTVWPY